MKSLGVLLNITLYSIRAYSFITCNMNWWVGWCGKVLASISYSTCWPS